MYTISIILLVIILILILSFIICLSNEYNLVIGGKLKKHLLHSNNILTYTISGEGNSLNYSQLRLLLKNASVLGVHFIEKPVTEVVDISFGTFDKFYIKGEFKTLSYDTKFYYQKAAIKNVLDRDTEFTTQSKLYYTVKELLPSGLQYLPKSYNTAEFENSILDTLDGSKIYIVKKNNSERQQGIILIASKEEYYIAKDKLYKAEIEYASIKNKKINYDAIISEYIINPLLLDNKKFHLRIYFLVSIVSGIIKCIVYNEYRLLTAKTDYKNSDWENQSIHLSGRPNTLHRYIYIQMI